MVTSYSENRSQEGTSPVPEDRVLSGMILAQSAVTALIDAPIEAPATPFQLVTEPVGHRHSADVGLNVAAIDKDFGSGHEAGLVSGEEQDGVRDLGRIGHTCERNLARHAGQKRLLAVGVPARDTA